MLLTAMAIAWGFGEATFFFLVPDILLTYIGVRYGARAAVRAAFFTTGGALVGGSLMYLWGVQSLETAVAFLDLVPAISADMIASVGEQLREAGVWTILAGGVSGIPFKIYAVQAPANGVSFIAFLLVSVPARLARFLATGLLAACIARLIDKWPARLRYSLLAIFWIVLYGFYFYTFG